ncbi:HigA family addiction module antitoxin [Leptospira alexanderi]|uniref:HigA family addiction module antitoxin n=1 Tax=Leptospira alexanderi TaxID=100053 RepID=UPI000990EF59|nr:HigA family addiction module antitoxin [Leptospira alexanderi]
MAGKIKNIHPGDVLSEDFLKPMQISIYRLSKETGLSQTRIGQVVRGERSVTAETALKLGKFFGIEPEFWLNLQNYYDLEEAGKQFKKELAAIHNVKELGLTSA